MSENPVVYTSNIRIERIKGPLRRVDLPQNEHVYFGVHSEIAEHYGIDTDIHNPHAATLDYVTASTGA